MPPTSSRWLLQSLCQENVSFPAHFIADRIANADVESTSLDSIALGQGKIVSIDGKKIAPCRNEKGELSLLSPVCPHLKCDIAWNSAERSWDCPWVSLHIIGKGHQRPGGSRP